MRWARDRLNLIEQLTSDAVASDYADAVPDPAPSSRRQRVLVAVVAAGFAGFILALGLSARVLNAPVVDDQRSALIDRIGQAERARSSLNTDVAALREQAEAARADELANVQGGAALAVSISRYELATGYTAVRGPGVVVTLSDAPDDGDDDSTNLDAVIDSDVQSAVNGLWQAGAEAVAVNDQRLTARSAIRSAAGAILVNYRPLRPPYRVAAIGDPDRLEQAFRASQGARELAGVAAQFGIGFDTASADEIELPAATTALQGSAHPIPSSQPSEQGETE